MENQPIPGLWAAVAGGEPAPIPKPRRGGGVWRRATVRRDCADCVDAQAAAYRAEETIPARERAAYALHVETIGGDAIGFYCPAHAQRRGYHGRA
jgi:hypothetical protein